MQSPDYPGKPEWLKYFEGSALVCPDCGHGMDMSHRQISIVKDGMAFHGTHVLCQDCTCRIPVDYADLPEVP